MSKITKIPAEAPLISTPKERLIQAEAKAAALEKEKSLLLAEIKILRRHLQKAQKDIRFLKQRVELFESGDQGGYHVMK